MAWIRKQPRLTQVFVYVVGQLNDIGIRPNGAEIKPWLRQEMTDEGITADSKEIATLLSGLLAEKAITQADLNRMMQNAQVRREH